MMNSSNLVKRATELKARLNKLNTSFGLVQYRDVVLRRKFQILQNGIYVDATEDVELSVVPKVENIHPNQIGQEIGENVYLSNNDFRIQIVRNIDIPEFEFLIIDPVYDSNHKLIRGIKCKLLHISDNKLFDWVLYVRRLKDNFKV